MSPLPMVLTLEAAAERLLTTPAQVQAELEAGRLDGFHIGEEWRTTEPALLKFMGVAAVDHRVESASGQPAGRAAAPAEARSFDVPATVASLTWSDIGAFTFHWQVEGTLSYEGREARLKLGLREIPLRIGFRTQEFAGDKDRRRAIVFMGQPPSLIPLVEFAGEDSSRFAETGRLASIIKHPGGQRHVRPGEPIPPEYAGLPVNLYTNLVTGPYAARSMAIVAHKDDYGLMAHHALIRARWKGLI